MALNQTYSRSLMSSVWLHGTQKTLIIHTWMLLNKCRGNTVTVIYVCVLQWIYINNAASAPHSVYHGLLGTLACDRYCFVSLIRNFLGGSACVNTNILILGIILLTLCSHMQIGSVFECRASSAAESGACVDLWCGS